VEPSEGHGVGIFIRLLVRAASVSVIASAAIDCAWMSLVAQKWLRKSTAQEVLGLNSRDVLELQLLKLAAVFQFS
jgi:hypothetical protein